MAMLMFGAASILAAKGGVIIAAVLGLWYPVLGQVPDLGGGIGAALGLLLHPIASMFAATVIPAAGRAMSKRIEQ
ncbi:hypothetical protein [Ideonella livida]|uniref:Uncharacterized protein n=1 Tax=Ideonella livida TaxID=2707176 RepID=A0A7C9PEQ9_9BURK|nr:hypothetical protein [Ideonella livida]NDY89692.1 hypothetical protein [Ideonella livida]